MISYSYKYIEWIRCVTEACVVILQLLARRVDVPLSLSADRLKREIKLCSLYAVGPDVKVARSSEANMAANIPFLCFVAVINR